METYVIVMLCISQFKRLNDVEESILVNSQGSFRLRSCHVRFGPPQVLFVSTMLNDQPIPTEVSTLILGYARI